MKLIEAVIQGHLTVDGWIKEERKLWERRSHKSKAKMGRSISVETLGQGMSTEGKNSRTDKVLPGRWA